MAKSSIKVRAKVKKGEAKVKCLISHPMETGLRKNKKTGKLIPARFIQEVVCESSGKTVMNAQWNGTISKNPFLSFAFSGAKSGDKIKISWVDNTGKSDSTEATMK
ncbi:MAG TPA: thiosulfate oxidation carrier complex protein SoxZ [Gammaproteobacteria bacterium]|nr:thiosulfate oxidation carrier complex protein SoxZ [Gammaproteobacteria bacterium]